MPLSNDDRKSIEQEVLRFITNDFYQSFIEIYGLTISIAEKHPDQVNNEIRNALTHISRSLCDDITLDEARQNIKQAHGHLERAKRDCLKLSIITKREQIASSVFRIETCEGAVPKSIKTRLRGIEKKRKDLFKKETKGDVDISNDLASILADALELEEQLLEKYNDPGTIISALRRYWQKTKSVVFAASFAILCSLTASYLYAYAVTPDDPVGGHIKKILEILAGHL